MRGFIPGFIERLRRSAEGGAEGPGAASRLGHTQNEATDLPADDEHSPQTRQDRGAVHIPAANSTALPRLNPAMEPAERLGFLVGDLPGLRQELRFRRGHAAAKMVGGDEHAEAARLCGRSLRNPVPAITTTMSRSSSTRTVRSEAVAHEDRPIKLTLHHSIGQGVCAHTSCFDRAFVRISCFIDPSYSLRSPTAAIATIYNQDLPVLQLVSADAEHVEMLRRGPRS